MAFIFYENVLVNLYKKYLHICRYFMSRFAVLWVYLQYSPYAHYEYVLAMLLKKYLHLSANILR